MPPHERTWRHPSELGPTTADVDTGSPSHVGVLAVGTLAVLAVAMLVVVVSPRPSAGPTAISVTTTPATLRPVLSTTSGADTTAANRHAAIGSTASVLLAGFASYPHTVVAAPQPDLDGRGVASAVPRDGEVVYVRTEDVTYRIAWDQVAKLAVADGSVVFDASGAIIARIADGALVTLVED